MATNRTGAMGLDGWLGYKGWPEPSRFGGWTAAARDLGGSVALGVRSVYDVPAYNRLEATYKTSPWFTDYGVPFPDMPSIVQLFPSHGQCVAGYAARGCEQSGWSSNILGEHWKPNDFNCGTCLPDPEWVKANELLPAIISHQFKWLRNQMRVEPPRPVASRPVTKRPWSRFLPSRQEEPTVSVPEPVEIILDAETGARGWVTPRLVGELRALLRLMDCVDWLNGLIKRNKEVTPGVQQPRPVLQRLPVLRAVRSKQWGVLKGEVRSLVSQVDAATPSGYRHIIANVSAQYEQLYFKSHLARSRETRRFDPLNLKLSPAAQKRADVTARVLKDAAGGFRLGTSLEVDRAYCDRLAQELRVTPEFVSGIASDIHYRYGRFLTEEVGIDGARYELTPFIYVLNIDEIQRLGVSDLLPLLAGPVEFLDSGDLIAVGPRSFTAFYRLHCGHEMPVRAPLKATDTLSIMNQGVMLARSQEVPFEKGLEMARLIYAGS